MAGVSKGPVEEFTVSGGGDAEDAPAEAVAAGPTRRPWRGPVAWVSCAVVLVLLGIVLARPLNLGVEPWGEVPDVTSVPREAWTVQPEEELHAALLAGGVLITAGAENVQGRAPGSGELLWELAMVGARCTTDAENLVCTDIASQVLQIDPHSGQATPLDVPEAIVATVVEGDIFALTRQEQGQLQRISGGEVLWSRPVTVAGSYRHSAPGLTVIAGHVLTTLVLDEADFGGMGAVFDASTGEQWDEQQLLVAQLNTGVWLADYRDGGAVFLRGADQPREIVGAGGFLQYDDQWQDSAQVGTTENDELGITDRDTGEWLWHTDYPAYPVARTGGVLLALVADGQTSAIQGIRAATGELLWEHTNGWLLCPCLSDGSTLVLQFHDTSADGSASMPATVVGLDVETGEQVWSIPRPSATFGLLTDGQHLVLASPAGLSGWRLG